MTYYSYFEFRWSRVISLRNSYKMITFFVVFFTIIAVLAAVILRAYFNQVIPEALPAEQHHKLRIHGIVLQAMGIVVHYI